MKERPILFSGEMVRAILSGAKTQTRRMVKPQPKLFFNPGDFLPDGVSWEGLEGPISIERLVEWCPYGQPGDRLWVRETWARLNDEGMEYFEYRADSDAPLPGQWPAEEKHDKECPRWRPSIHMPRLVSRITLEVTGVRVERLQDISEADARAEGVMLRVPPHESVTTPYRGEFYWLWDSINAKRAPWSSDPFVWVVEFKRIDI